MAKYGIWIKSLQTWCKETYRIDQKTGKYEPVYSLYPTLTEAKKAADELDWEIQLPRRNWKKTDNYIGKRFSGNTKGSPVIKFESEQISEETNLENLMPGFTQNNFDENMRKQAR
jgi:hypothetical protein|tara:strand:+ start:332 stop:676 length:345 start_codon:yes stop_codon:yes gene_type:complete